MKSASRVLAVLVLIVVGFVATGCKMIESREAMDKERVLAAAGFHMKFADTPEKIAHLETLPQRKLVPQDHDGEPWYVYADSTHCKCIYVGNEAAYQRYQKLAIQQQLAEDQVMAASMNENAAMNWGLWGGFGRFY